MSVCIHLLECLTISENDDKQLADINIFINDSIQVFGKVFFDPEALTDMKHKCMVESLGLDLVMFSKLVYKSYHGNLAVILLYHDDYSSFVRKATATFLHPCMSNNGMGICIYIATMLMTLVRLSNWDYNFFDHDQDMIEAHNTFCKQKDTLVISDLIINSHHSDSNIDIATAIRNNFRIKNFDKWAQNASILFTAMNTSYEYENFLVNEGKESDSQNKVEKLNITLKIKGTILINMLWSSSQRELYEELITCVISSYNTSTESRSISTNHTGKYDNSTSTRILTLTFPQLCPLHITLVTTT